ncbi:MAG: TonB-dependent receptor [Ketobacter sp.]|nr:MAG: TonB-dependent receptor [Ketobacter sp.]
MKQHFVTKLITTISIQFFSVSLFAHERDLFSISLEELMDIKVTSTSYFDQTRMDASSSVTHSDPAHWQELGVRTLGELLNNMPSTISPQGFASSRVTSIRGFFDFNSNSGIATRLDDIPVNKLRSGTGMLGIEGFDLATLSNVELIRGPGSAMHGADAFHGVISMQTYAPTEATKTVQLEAGTEQDGAGSVLAHFEGEQQGLTAVLSQRKLGDQALQYEYNEPALGQVRSGERSNELEISNLVVKYSAHVRTGTELYANAYLFNMDANQLPGIGATLGEPGMADKDWSYYRSLTSLMKLGMNHQWSDQSKFSVFGYYWKNEDVYNTDFRDTVLGVNVEEQRQESHWGLQAINRHSFDNGANLAYGYEYRGAVLDEFNVTALDNSGSLIEVQREEAGTESDSHSLLLDGRYPLYLFDLGKTEIVYGLRLDEFEEFDLQTSPRLGLLQHLNDRTVIKLLYGQAFRAPNLLERFGSEQIAANDDLQPEALETIELVLQTQFEHLFAGITLFANDWSDAIRTEALDVPVNGVDFQFQNTGQNKAYGFELETLARWNKFRFDTMLSHVRSKNDDTGEYFDAFPDWMLNIGVGYTFNANWDLYTSTRYHHRKQAAEVFSAAAMANQGPETFLRTDIVLAWMVSSSLTTRMTIRNLFNRDDFQPGYMGQVKGVPDNGINLSLSASWHL